MLQSVINSAISAAHGSVTNAYIFIVFGALGACVFSNITVRQLKSTLFFISLFSPFSRDEFWLLVCTVGPKELHF